MRPLADCLVPPRDATGFVVAYSGGLDSTVLLHLARAAGLRGLRAVHVHHGLQPAAEAWALRCQQQCADWGVPFELRRVSVAADDPQGPEAAARAARYAALSAAVPPGGMLLTAHHAGDQAETVLLRLLRGTGIAGLAAMPSLGFTPQGVALWRPLLALPRETLQGHAEAEGLAWTEDPHNDDPRYARSWLRTAVMPLLRQRWAETDALLSRAARHAAEAEGLLSRYAGRLLAGVQQGDGSLSVPGLLALDPAERHLLLRHRLRQLGLAIPHAAQLARLDAEVLAAGPDATPLLCWPGVECRRYRDALHIGPPLPPTEGDRVLDWDGAQPLVLPQGLGTLHSGQARAMQVRFGAAGLRLTLAGQSHRKSLKTLCQSAGIPPWWRERLPIVLVNRTVVSVAGRWNTQDTLAVRWQIEPRMGLPAHWQP